MEYIFLVKLIKDFTALILEWASKKLIKIELIDKYTVRLIKLQDFPQEKDIY